MNKTHELRGRLAIAKIAVLSCVLCLGANSATAGDYLPPDTITPEHIYRKPTWARDGNTVGVMFLPRRFGEGDNVEKALFDLAMDIPGVDIVFTARSKSQIFGQLRQLKDKGKKVDLLVLAGHVRLQDVEGSRTPRIAAIAVNPGNPDEVASVLTPEDIDIPFFKSEIEKRCKHPNFKNSPEAQAKLKEYCKELKDFMDVSEVMKPGAEVIVLSCNTGAGAQGTTFLTNLATAFMAKNGGKICGPITEVKVGAIGPFETRSQIPFIGWLSEQFAQKFGRVHQLMASIDAGKWLDLGDAFVSAGGWTKFYVNPLQMPECCKEKVQPSAGVYKRMSPEITRSPDVATTPYQAGHTTTITSESITFSRFDISLGRELKQTITYSPPPERLEPGQTVNLKMTCQTSDPKRYINGGWGVWWVDPKNDNPNVVSLNTTGSDSSNYSFVFNRGKNWVDCPTFQVTGSGYAGSATIKWKYEAAQASSSMPAD